MLKNNRGFTLIEMLIVLMIISVLIILIVPNLSGKSKQVHDKGCEALVNVSID
ncbi:prepilin-type N-terminal cleavage/methylation domain-containing protein [Virgibacillus halodenitrificans]|uniref:Prepilin-type N-terminal cleavage/methylation domain-containing protein n=1 Tax=Virgibacillus halodenitrificans TaxID=1482 RepID=A0ABR7VQC4_VIRHA|nr:prepilin-type N-terminal cleavage/methylation domain-containing protein [Virgibacillus halodenitrificans]MBD1222742.1 prepilin-type N-terminal cleavage/methylation domain-containing protein [Virgibacillus halodenitrificans]